MAEILATIGTALGAVTQVNEYILTPITNQFSYLFFYKSNIQSLGAQVEELNQIRDNLQLEVDAAKRNAEAIGRDVEDWFKKVAEINAKKDRIIQDGALLQQGCLYGSCPNIKLRYCLSREAKNATEAASKLLTAAGNFRKISFPAQLEPIPTKFAGIEVDSRNSKEDEIMKALKDGKVYAIAVCGMGGVGKTTMVKKIEDRVREEKMFAEVVMAVVSRPLELQKVQLGIVEGLGLKFDEQTTPARAKRLHKRLKDAKSVLIILDDVWEKFNLQEIGIPSKSSHEGCKVILTSRIPSVCRKIEDSAKIIELDVLSELEGWNLFKEKAGKIVEKPDLYPIAVDVAKECKGLPLALVAVAAALKDSSVQSWKDALHQLKESLPTNIPDVEEQVFVPLKWSFDQLRSEEARYLFLLCCLFPEDYTISLDTLVRYGFGLRIFGIGDLGYARNRVYTLVEMLKDRFLLTGSTLGSEADCTQYDCVKMHDIIRDMAISIASKEKHVFLVVHDRNLKEWPTRDSYDNYTCISLGSGCKITLPENISCPRLEMLCLSFVEGGVEIQENSFCGMRELKVLITHDVHSLPSSFPLLTNVRSLVLESSKMLELPNEIGELVNLEILSLANSGIRMLQKEIGRLKNLKLLDLTNCLNLKNIAPGAISGLVQLEELFILNSFQNWEAKGTERNNASVAEVASLTKLTTLHIRVPRENRINFTEDTRNWHKLTRYNVHIGTWPRDYNSDINIKRKCIIDFESEINITQRYITLYLSEVVHLPHSVRVMLDNAEVLQLEGQGSSEIANQLSRDGYQNLRILCLKGCGNLEFLFDSSSWNLPNTAFLPRATQLRIYFMADVFKEVCRGQPPAGSFSNLTFIELRGCDDLKNLFSFSIAAMLSNLEIVHIQQCYTMETVFFEQNGQCGSNAISKIAFPKLSEIKFSELSSFSGFCKATETIAFELPEEQFLFDQKVLCSGLRILELIDMKFKVRIFDPRIPIGNLFGLESLKLVECSGSVNLFSNSTCKGIPNLESLRVDDCPMLQEVIAKDREEETNSEVTLFPQLKELLLYSLPKIQQFCHINHSVELPSLDLLYIWNCPLMKTFSQSLAGSDSNIGIHSFFDGVTFSRIQRLLLQNVNAAGKLFGRGISIGNLRELEELTIRKCPMLEEVISEEDKKDEKNTVETLFPKLKKLELQELPNLSRFCHIKHDVRLPSLEKITIKHCPALETFSLGSVYVPNSANVWLYQNFTSEYFIKG